MAAEVVQHMGEVISIGRELGHDGVKRTMAKGCGHYSLYFDPMEKRPRSR